jgi:lysophospholipase L1-like esterase
MPTIGFSYLAYQDVNAHNRALYTLDGLHPNDAGYVRMANAIIPWLERI